MDIICPAVIGIKSAAFANETEFYRWVTETQKSLVRFCRQIVGDWYVAEDMAQEAYLRAWEKRGSFKGNCLLLTWQMAIARRVCLDHLRHSKRNNVILLREHDSALMPDIETSSVVQRVLATLKADDRAILYLRVDQDLSFKEIGCVLGRNETACRKQYERAKQRFKAAYSGKED